MLSWEDYLIEVVNIEEHNSLTISKSFEMCLRACNIREDIHEVPRLALDYANTYALSMPVILALCSKALGS